jgi:glycosyltransferase involved in cell wall biosynthesis
MESIVSQSFGDMEVICIDDGSTDDSPLILDEYSEKYSFVSVVHKDNSGYGDSLNIGMSRAKGDYIGIVESDDYIEREMYEKLLSTALLHNDPDMVRAIYFDKSDSECVKREWFDPALCGKVICAKEYYELFTMPCNIWSGIYRRDFLESNKIRFLPTPGASYQDTSFYFKVLACEKTIVLLNEPLYYYRIDNSGSSIHSTQKVFCFKDELEEIDHFIEKNAQLEPYIEGIRIAVFCLAYNWHFYRVHPFYRFAIGYEYWNFIQKNMDSPFFDKKYWRKENWNIVQRIISNPGIVLENSKWVFEQAYLNHMTIKTEVYSTAIEQYMEHEDKIIIYGAGKMGKRVYAYFERKGWTEKVVGFAVTSKKTDPVEIDGKSVKSITEYAECKNNLVLVAVAENSQQEILENLKQLAFDRVIRVDAVFRQKMDSGSKGYGAGI